jgi:hypothetical protein
METAAAPTRVKWRAVAGAVHVYRRWPSGVNEVSGAVVRNADPEPLLGLRGTQRPQGRVRRLKTLCLEGAGLNGREGLDH